MFVMVDYVRDMNVRTPVRMADMEHLLFFLFVWFGFDVFVCLFVFCCIWYVCLCFVSFSSILFCCVVLCFGL